MVVIRLSRAGTKKKPFYHLAVADKQSPRDGRFIERVGFYNPIARGKSDPLRVDLERIDYWLSVGAQLSPKVKSIVARARILDALPPESATIAEPLSSEVEAKEDAITKTDEEAAQDSDSEPVEDKVSEEAAVEVADESGPENSTSDESTEATIKNDDVVTGEESLALEATAESTDQEDVDAVSGDRSGDSSEEEAKEQAEPAEGSTELSTDAAAESTDESDSIAPEVDVDSSDDRDKSS